MSAGFLDDSSDLVEINANDNHEDAHTTDESVKRDDSLLDLPDESDEASDAKEHFSKEKDKSAKGRAKKLLKRAKSPITGALHKTHKEFKKLSHLPKHHHTSSPKSPQRSPSRENLTEEYSHLEQKLAEKKSEEWQAFMQMQDRIKQTVLKTQTSLNKYSSQSDEEDPKREKGKKSKWQGFDEANELGLDEHIDTTLNPSINISCANGNSDSVKLIDSEAFDNTSTTVSTSCLDTGILTSPPISPGPPVNSRITSMDNIANEAQPQVQKNVDEFDLLGLGANSALESVPDISKSSNVLTDDLLGFDNFGSSSHDAQSAEAQTTASKPSDDFDIFGFNDDSSNVLVGTVEAKPIVANTTEASLVQGDTKEPIVDTDLGDDFLGLSSAPAVSTVSTTSVAQVNKPMANIDLDLFGDPLEPAPATETLQPAQTGLQPSKDPFTPVKVEPVLDPPNLAATMVPDDFASFDPMKADAMDSGFQVPSSTQNPFTSTSSPIPFQADKPTSATNIQYDILSKIQKMAGGNQASPVRRQSQKRQQDPFNFVKQELKKPVEDDEDYRPLAALVKQAEPTKAVEETMEEDQKVPDETSTGNNPFLSGDIGDETMYANTTLSGNVAEMFGLESDNMQVDDDFSAFDNIRDHPPPVSGTSPWTDVTVEPVAEKGAAFQEEQVPFEMDMTFEPDNAWETATAAEPAEDAWGVQAETVIADTTTDFNPFQDDFSKLEDVPATEQTDASANPFLSEDLLNPVPCLQSIANPFMDEPQDHSLSPKETTSFLDKPPVLSDSESFFLDSVEVKEDLGETDDIFDPFKVTKPKTPVLQEGTEGKKDLEAPDELDIFSAVAASGDKQLAKPSDDDDRNFVLEIKPATEAGKATTSVTAPLLKPPPKPPKSPQPPRENPFDRDSPPEEDFAQFEIKDNEKPREPPPKSMSTDSTTTDEEELKNLEPLEPFLSKIEKEGFKLLMRYPTKKKIAGNRYWKNVYVKMIKHTDGPLIKVFNDANDSVPIQELPLQACYSLSDLALQQYDQYGKIHTVKLQYVFYKERVGIKTERITPSLVKFKKRNEKPKANMILDHSPQVSELLKFGSLDKQEVLEFIQMIEDTFMNLEVHREKTLTYTKDEITAEVRDEYYAELDKFGKVLSQKARVRIFMLAFLTGMPTVEMGINDKRRQGLEVVGRCDIIPIKTEEWIRMEDVEFHCCVDKEEYEKTTSIKFRPLDACQFELMRYRVRLRENKELPLQLTVQQILKDRKCEVRCDLLVTGYHSYSKKHGQFPCEDIEVRFPIPEVWIYMFRYERRFGYGSIHSATRKPGKIKGLERLTMMAQGNVNQALMEADVGTAKYEHVYRSVVWRIPRLPVRNQGAYTSHLFKLKLDLGPHDDIPDTFQDFAHVEFNMPGSTTSQSQIRSIAVTNPNPPEKWVRLTAKYQYRIEIEHLNEYPEFMAIGTVYKEATRTASTSKSEEENGEEEEPERDPRLAVSDSDSSDSD